MLAGWIKWGKPQVLRALFACALPVQLAGCASPPSERGPAHLPAASSRLTLARCSTLRPTQFLPYPGSPGLREALPEAAVLEMVRKGWGYSMVRTVDGRLGEVPSEDLGPLGDGIVSPKSPPRRSVGTWIKASAEADEWKLDTPPESEKIEFRGAETLPPVEPELPAWDME